MNVSLLLDVDQLEAEWTLPFRRNGPILRCYARKWLDAPAANALRGPEMSREGKGKGAGYTERHPRVSVHCDAILCEADGCELAVVITDVSRDGFRLMSRCELEVGSEVLLRVGRMEPVRAMIRWTRGYEAGGVFLEPVSLS